MALLLAALMVVTAFAGCAGVKQEAFDGLEDRVEALEGKIDGVDSSIKELGDKIPTGNDNKEQLDQITGTLDKIVEQLGKVEDRVTEVENKPVTGGTTTDAAAKAAAQTATAKIEIMQNDYAKDADKYTEADYAAILTALGTAKSAVAAATTVAEVDKAMADLENTLKIYMTYAELAYYYYEELLGNINADAEELIDEVTEFLDDAADYYDGKAKADYVPEGKIYGTVDKDGKPETNLDTLTEVESELLYLAIEATKEANNQYINIYKALETFVEIFNGKATKTSGNVIFYVNEKDKVVSENFGSLAYYEKLADALVDDIDEVVGEELVYSVDKDGKVCAGLDGLFDRYDEYVEIAELLGGETLVDLITNADALAKAEDEFDNLVEAVKAFKEATVVSRTEKKDVFYYYDQLADKKALQYYDAEEEEYVWVADVYETVDELLADWIEAYDLSDENVNAIITEVKGENYYTKENVKYTDTNAANTYVANKHYNDLLVAACDEFADEILPLIEALNGASATSVQLALDFNEIEDLLEELVVLQEKDKDAEYPANIDMPKLSAANLMVIFEEADLFADMKWDEEVEAERYADIEGVIDLFTFEADIDQLEDVREGDGYYYYNEDEEKVDDNRKNGDIYKFFTETYAQIKLDAKAINDRIATFVEAVEDNTLANDLEAFELSGDYVKLEGTAEKPVKYNGDEFTTTVYVALTDYLKDNKLDLDEYMEDVAASSSIAAFVYHNEDFAALLDTADFEAAQKVVTAHIQDLFADIDAIVDLVEKIDYVRDGAVIYTDDNKNGKYDDTDTIVKTTVSAKVSLNDAAAVKAAVTAYNKWVGEGGSTDIAYFGNFVDAENVKYDDVYTLNDLNSDAVAEINAALTLLDKLDAAIQDLEAKADHFVKAVANAKAVQSGSNPFKVNLSGDNHFDGSEDIDDYAWISRTLSTSENTDSAAGSYKYVVGTKVWTTTTGSNEKIENYKKNTAGYLKANSLTKLKLVQTIVDLYVDFKAANVDYVADADNDYDNDDAVLYYQDAKYVEYKAFEDAVKSYEAIDLLSVKGYILKVTEDTKADSAVAAFRSRIINEGKDLATVQNFVYQYNLSAENGIYADKLADIAIYNFTRLAAPAVTPTAE
jgi:hypothetical protein